MTKRPRKKSPTKKYSVKTGRPTDYDPKFHPADYIRLASEGKPRFSICAAWGIHRDTLHSWSTDKRNAEFTDAIKKGDEARAAWFTNLLLGQATGQIKGNVAAAIFLAKNVCPKDFRDKIDHAHTLEVEDMIFEDEGDAA